MNDNKFGLFIKELRNEKGLSQEELGEILFVHRTSINKWEKGNVIPLNDTLLRISEFFDVSVDELLNGRRNNQEEKSSTNRAIIDLIRSNKKLYKVLFFLGIAFFIMLLIFLSYYFVTTYDSIHVYRVNGKNEKIKMRDGLMIVSNDKLYFRIGDFYYKDEKITIDDNTKIKIIYRENDEDNILLQGDARDLFVELSSSKELLIKLLEKNKPLYIKVEYKDIMEEIKLWYYEDFSNDSIISNDVDSICKENPNDNFCDNYSDNQIEGSNNTSKNIDNKIKILIKNEFKYDANKDLYYLNRENILYNYYKTYNKLAVIEKSNNKYTYYTIYFNDKSFKKTKKLTDNEVVYINNYCEIDKLNKNYLDYKNFYNKILPHYFRDFLGCE